MIYTEYYMSKYVSHAVSTREPYIPTGHYRLLHGIFHIGPGISPRLPYQARQQSWRADIGRELIPGTIWKMPCNDLLITYFQAEEMRIYVKHNFNMNIFIMNITF
jgi:hypothetical protein